MTLKCKPSLVGYVVARSLRLRVGEDMCLIGVGGVVTADDARALLDAGANLVQGYTALVYEGPLWPSRINRQLATGAPSDER